MSTSRTIVGTVLFSLMCASSAAPQAPPSVMYARVAYMTLKATTNPQGELKDTLAAKYPDIWAAIGPVAGSGAPATVEKMRGIPQVVVHGDNDPTVSVAGSRTMVAEMKRLGVNVHYIEVPGGNHTSVVAPNLEAIVGFFDAHTKAPRPAPAVK